MALDLTLISPPADARWSPRSFLLTQVAISGNLRLRTNASSNNRSRYPCIDPPDSLLKPLPGGPVAF
jgi:hypothetical protein